MKCLLTFLLFALAAGSPAHAEEISRGEFYISRQWDVADGLPTNRINALAQTPEGYFWMGTQEGLVRFDGVRFKTFEIRPLSPTGDPQVTCLLADPTGNLWITGGGGLLMRFENDGLEVVLPSLTEGKDEILSMAIDEQGELWFAAGKGGLLSLKHDQTPLQVKKQKTGNGSVTQITKDGTGKLIALIGGKLRERRNSGEWEALEKGPDSSFHFRAVTHTPQQGLILATTSNRKGHGPGAHYFRWHEGQLTTLSNQAPWSQNLMRARANRILEAQDGRIWCGTMGDGIYYRDLDEQWIPLISESPLRHVKVNDMLEDHFGSIWVATEAGGLFQIRRSVVLNLNIPWLVRGHNVSTIAVAQDGAIHAGTDGAGIFQWRNTRYGSGVKKQPAAAWIHTLLADRQGRLWMGNKEGLFQWNKTAFNKENKASPKGGVECLFEDSNGALWIGGAGRLVRLHESTIDHFGEREGLPSSTLSTIAEDHDGRIWLITKDGSILQQSGQRFEAISTPIPDWFRDVRDMRFDQDGHLWIATYGSGIVRFSGGKFLKWDRYDDRIPSSRIVSLVMDKEGTMWAGTEGGIVRFIPRKLVTPQGEKSKSPGFLYLSRKDGMLQNQCTGIGSPVSALAKDGRVLIPNGNKIAEIHPPDVEKLSAPGRIQIENLIVDGVDLDFRNSNPIELHGHFRRIEIRYTRLGSISPETTSFETRLRGFDTEWSDVGNQRIANFSSLVSGDYVFEVRADGVPANGKLAFRVIPPFFDRPLVRLAGIGLLLVLVGGGVWIGGRIRTTRKLELMRMERRVELERQRIARNIHDDLGSRLTEILLLGKNLAAEGGHTEDSKAMINEISTCAGDLTQAMDEVVWAVDARNDSIENLANYLNDFAQKHLSLAGISYRLDAPGELPERPLSAEVRHNLLLASKEALNNVAKHSSATEAWLRIRFDDPLLCISIIDNGRGADEERYTAGRHGFENMSKRLGEIGGSCQYGNREQAGFQVLFEVDLSQISKKDMKTHSTSKP